MDSPRRPRSCWDAPLGTFFCGVAVPMGVVAVLFGVVMGVLLAARGQRRMKEAPLPDPPNVSDTVKFPDTGNVSDQGHGRRRTLRYGVVLVATIVLTLFNGVILRFFDIMGLPAVFGFDLVVQVLLLVLLLFSLVVVLRTPLKVVWSIVLSALRGAGQNDYVQRVRDRIPFLLPWISRRFSRDRPTGLGLTLGVFTAGFLTVLFLNVTHAVASGGLYAGIDQRVVTLMPSIRTSGESSFFAFFTFAASYLGIIFFIIVLAIVGLIRRQWWLPVLFAFAYGLEALCSAVSKNALHRPRPDGVLRELPVSGFSYPSGHVLAATVIYGLLAYVLIRSIRSYLLRLFIIVLAVTMVLLVGISRVYFAVHYPTDVVGGVLLGSVILTVLVTAVEMTHRYRLVKKWTVTPAVRGSLVGAVVPTLIFVAVFSGPFTPLHETSPSTTPQALAGISSSTVARLPHYSETLTGARMEPISLIFIGNQAHIEQAFTTAGWYKADPPTVGNSLHEFLTAAQNQQYLTAPVTPSYLDAKPQDLAFEKPTSTNTLQQRHHTRMWKLNFEVNGQPVWVATASLDTGIGVGSKVPLPTHHIDPNVDAERAYILNSLGITSPTYVEIVAPQLGHNASGDSFFTDGDAAVTDL
jgi:membrane-associated phospholipid phosphatase